jgi:hypothetical protein
VGIALGADYEGGVILRLLQETEEHGRHLILGEGAVFAVFHYADDFSALAAPIFEMAAYSLLDGTEDLDGEGAVHKGGNGSGPPYPACLFQPLRPIHADQIPPLAP